jgi:F0F1-type ATP synthase membrane subunit b/b'
MSGKVIVFPILFLVMASLLVASSEDPDSHHFNWGRFIGSVLNSTILFGALILFLRKPLIKMLSQRSIEVKTDIVEREKNVKLTGQQFDTIKRRLDQIEGEVKEMQQTAQQNGEREKSKIEELGTREAKRILDITESEIRNRIESSVTNLKSRIAQLTIDHFKKDIQAHLDEAKQRQLIDRNIEKAGEIVKGDSESKSGDS